MRLPGDAEYEALSLARRIIHGADYGGGPYSF